MEDYIYFSFQQTIFLLKCINETRLALIGISFFISEYIYNISLMLWIFFNEVFFWVFFKLFFIPLDLFHDIF